MSRAADILFDLAVIAAIVAVIVGVWTWDVVAAKVFATAILVAAIAGYVAQWVEQKKQAPTRPPRLDPLEVRRDTVSEEEHQETRPPR